VILKHFIEESDLVLLDRIEGEGRNQEKFGALVHSLICSSLLKALPKSAPSKLSSIPDTSSTMMWDGLRGFSFSLLSEIVQEKVDQYCIDICVGMLLDYMASNELNAPDTAATQLDLPGMTRRYGPESTDGIVEWRTVDQTAQRVKYLRDAVV